MQHSLKKMETQAEGLYLEWHDGTPPELFSWQWLRDHSLDNVTYSPKNFQREKSIFDLGGIKPRAVEFARAQSLIEIEWSDGIKSEFSIGFFESLLAPKSLLGEFQKGWPTADQLELLEFRYPTFLTSDEELRRFLEQLAVFGVGLVEGCPATADATRAVLERLGYLRNSIWGDLWTFENNEEFNDFAYMPVGLACHTDGTYSIDPPGLQSFHCLLHDGEGGASCFVDGLAIAEEIRAQNPAHFQTLLELQIPAHYKARGLEIRAQHTVVQLDRDQTIRQVCFNDNDRIPFWLGFEAMAEFYEAYGHFYRLANDPARQLQLKLTPGTVLVLDNWRVLHGRQPFSGRRVLCGAYHNREDFESLLRQLDQSRDR